MANSEPSNNVAQAPRPVSVFAAVLSYLVPGLGQIYQGRVAKGILFLVCLYGLFFTGMAMGDWKSVYIPDAAALPPVSVDLRLGGLRLGPFEAHGTVKDLAYRVQYLGQFWIGIAAWPAIAQHLAGTPYVEMPDGSRGKIVLKEGGMGKDGARDFVHSPTMGDMPVKKLAGNTVEIETREEEAARLPLKSLPLLGEFMAEPDEDRINQLLRDSDKAPDLGWVYTVIAGVLNILVIYDAFAGPAFGTGTTPAAMRPPTQEVASA